jgi:serine/threonine-protein kinase
MFSPSSGFTVGGRYRLEREIGAGAMGSVWAATDLQLDAPCALKFIIDRFATDGGLRERFLREARIAGRLRSPHAVQVLGVGEWEGALYIAMELLEGEPLVDRLERVGCFSPRDTALILEQVAGVLDKAHAAGIVHRDLKPANLWLWPAREPFVKVLDFGVAKQIDPTSQSRTATGAVVGTPRYMSPEQASGARQVDHRSDVWSLAVVASECLTGRPVFDAGGVGDLLVKIISGPVPGLHDTAPHLPAQLAQWWRTATARDPSQRFQSAGALSHAFQLALEASRAGSFGANVQSLQGTVRVDTQTPHEPPAGQGGSRAPGRPRQSDGGTSVSAVSNVATLEPSAGAGGGSGPRRGSPIYALALSVSAVAVAGGLTAWWLTGNDRVAEEAPSSAALSSVDAGPSQRRDAPGEESSESPPASIEAPSESPNIGVTAPSAQQSSAAPLASASPPREPRSLVPPTPPPKPPPPRPDRSDRVLERQLGF